MAVGSRCRDTHDNNIRHLRGQLAAPADMAFARSLEDLADRDLLDETLVVWMGELGRSARSSTQGERWHRDPVRVLLTDVTCR